MNCQKTRGLFSEYLDGCLASDVDGRVRAHLHECAACRLDYEEFGKTVRAMSGLESRRVSRDFNERLFQRLDALQVGPGRAGMALKPLRKAPASLRSPWRLVLGMAALASLGIAGLQIHSVLPAPPARVYISACVQAHATFKALHRPTPRTTTVAEVNPDAAVSYEAME